MHCFLQIFNCSTFHDDYFYDYYDDPDEDEKGPALEIYGTDITELARSGKLEECYGREKELLELMEILVRRQKNNPVLVGDAGVGKTAVVELFANRIVNNLVPFVLEGRTIINLDLARIVAGSRYRGEFELRFQKILDEVLQDPSIIVFIDEIHNIGGTGSAEGSLDAANILKPVLSRSGFQCIGATTLKEYQKIEKDPALNRRFQPIKIKEPSVDNTMFILYGLRPSLEAYHNVEILSGAIRSAAELSSRYIYDRHLPDKAIDLLDRAAAKEVIKMTTVVEGSVISAYVNSALLKIGSLRIEAFRRGDIPAEYIFQEIENAYRNLLFNWIEDPSIIPDKAPLVDSPISDDLFKTIRITVLKRADDLLFASLKPRFATKTIRKISKISSSKMLDIFDSMNYMINSDMQPVISVFRISIFLFKEWLASQKLRLSQYFKKKYIENICIVFHQYKMYKHICKIRKNVNEEIFFFSREKDFYEEDVESYQETVELVSELEEKKIEVVKEYLKEIKPVLRRGIVESLKESGQIPLNDEEISIIYNLLGYFSTETGRDFLANLDAPDIVRISRKLADVGNLKNKIGSDKIRTLIAEMTGIPLQTISYAESQKLMNLETTLHERVIGQEEAISAIAKAIRRSRLGIQNPNRPIASFLFCGPTGVGKTEVTKALAVSMFGAESDMIRLDMSEFMEKFTISRLIGAPPGYVGYEEGGQLTDAVRRKPYSVVLFDEVEKAHPDVLNILLQILEDGRLTDSQKRLVPFENTVIILTSNAAAEEIQDILNTTRSAKQEALDVLQQQQIETNLTKRDKDLLALIDEDKQYKFYQNEYDGVVKFLESPIKESFLSDIRDQLQTEFDKSFRDYNEFEVIKNDMKKVKLKREQVYSSEEILSELKEAVLERLSTMFLPEFLNRLDDIIIFQPLKPEELRKICDLMIRLVVERVKKKDIFLTVDETVRLKLTREGYNPAFGARPLRRMITKYVEDLISETVLRDPGKKKERFIKITLDEEGNVVAKGKKEGSSDRQKVNSEKPKRKLKKLIEVAV